MRHRSELMRIACVALVAGGGCISAKHTHHTPEAPSFEMPEETTFRSAAPVTVVPPAGDQGRSILGIFPYNSMSVDYAEYSEQLVRVVREAIAANGVSIDSSADRRVELGVLHVIHSQNVCYVHARLETGSGYVRGFTGEARSMWPEKGCNVAITRLAKGLVGDAGLRLYLEGGDPGPTESASVGISESP